MTIEHKHEYETLYHPRVSAEAAALGIKAVEIRTCGVCKHEVPFIQIGDQWVLLYEEQAKGAQDILLA